MQCSIGFYSKIEKGKISGKIGKIYIKLIVYLIVLYQC